MELSDDWYSRLSVFENENNKVLQLDFLHYFAELFRRMLFEHNNTGKAIVGPVQNMKEVVMWPICMPSRFSSTFISSNWTKKRTVWTKWWTKCRIRSRDRWIRREIWVDQKRDGMHMRYVTTSFISWTGSKLDSHVSRLYEKYSDLQNSKY